jgi:hypothetical protein
MVCEYRPLVGAAVELRAHWALSTSAPVDTTPVVPPDIKPPGLKVRTLEAFAAVALAGVAAGDVRLEVTQGGTAIGQTLFLPVQ